MVDRAFGIVLVFIVFVFAALSPTTAETSEAFSKSDALSYFGQAEQYLDASLSPDGTQYAIWRMRDGHPQTIVQRLDKNSTTAATVFDLPASLFNWQFWVNETSLLISTTNIRSDSIVLSGQYRGSSKKKGKSAKSSGLTRILWVADVTTGGLRQLLSFPLSIGLANGSDDFLHRLPSDPDHVMIAYAPNGGDYPGVYKIDIQSGAATEIVPPEKPYDYWSVDRAGALRLASGWGDEQLEVKVRSSVADQWESLSGHALFKNGRFGIIGYSDDGNNLYVRSSIGKGRSVIYRFDMKRRAIRQKIFEHPKYDAGTLVMADGGKAILGATYVDDRPRIEVLDVAYGAHLEQIEAALGTDEFYSVDISDAGKKWLIHKGSADQPGQLYLYDGETQQVRHLLDVKAGKKPDRFADVKAVTYFSRDGLEIPAYLTIPVGRKSGEKIPMIVMPHGGPWVRDMKTYDNWVQFFANRGYGVFQPNFRGSTGYGDAFEAQGYGEWGQAMQNDLTDGAEWLIAQGYADQSNLCMVGASYGGYAALMAAAKSPETFECAISIAPVSDLSLWLRMISSSRAEHRALMYRTVGGTKSKLLNKQSPAFLGKKMDIPILLAHGTADIRVPPEHSRRMEKVLKKYRKDHSILWLEGGSHFVLQAQHRKKLFQASLDFLEKYIGP